MKKIIYFLFIILLLSCKSSTDSTNLRFAYKENYKIDDKEKTIALNKEIINEYEKINGDLKINLPLNRYIYSNYYKVYIAVAIENNIKEVAEAYSNDGTLKLIDSKKIDNYYNLFCKKNGLFLIKTLYNEKKENLPVILNLVGKDSLQIRTIYNENKLIEKIK